MLVRRNPEVDISSVVLSSISEVDPSISSSDGDVGVDEAIASGVVSSANSAVVVNEARSGNHIATVAGVVKTKANSANVLVFVVSETSSAIVDGSVGFTEQDAVVASVDVSVLTENPLLSSAVSASIVASSANTADVENFSAFDKNASSTVVQKVSTSRHSSAIIASVVKSTANVANVVDSSSVRNSVAISASVVLSVADSALVINSSSVRN